MGDISGELRCGWMLVRSVQQAPAAQVWSLTGIVAAGLLLMFCARFVLRSRFFGIRRESDTSQGLAASAER